MKTYLAGKDYLRGVNLYSLQQQRSLDVNDTIPDTQQTWDYLASRGFSIVRLPIAWERLQPIKVGQNPRDALAGPVSAEYLDLVEEQVRRAKQAGIRVVLDLHNGCTFPWSTGPNSNDTLYCGDGLTASDVLKVWNAISQRFVGNEGVAAYNLFNEPRSKTGSKTYFEYVNDIVRSLRSGGDDRAVWVDAILGSSFATDAAKGPPIDDPAQAVIYSQHFYLNGGTRESLLSRIRDFGEWCDNSGSRCAIGEIGWPETVGAETVRTFEMAYDLADHYLMDVTYFAATSVPDPKALIAYYAEKGERSISANRAQADVIENHPSR